MSKSSRNQRPRTRSFACDKEPVRRRTDWGTRRLAVLMAAVVVALPTALDAQQRSAHTSAVAPDSLRHIQVVEPRFGPAGTEVSVYTENLPLQARVHIGVGRTGFGWEALAEAEQGELGEVGATVLIPEFATWERPLVFIVFNGIFSPIGISDPFHVTDDRGMVLRRGRVTDEGLSCLTLRDEDDYVYALTGDVGDLSPGDEVVVEGTYSEASPCTEGSSIGVVEVTAVTSG